MTEALGTNTDQGRRGLQSPINIDKLVAIPKLYPAIVMSGHAEDTTKMTLTNTGHTVEIRPSIDSPGAYLRGGPLKEKYKFLQLHFHWGSTNALGSEHSINGNFYSLEAHFVHYNQKYENFEASCKESDGLAVVAIFFEVNDGESEDVDRPEISRITNHLASVKTAGTTVDVPPDVLAWMKDYCFCCSQYYTYHGSLTTPPFTENVTWLIYPIPLEIGKRQLNLFRQINGLEKCRLASNRRQAQPLDGRQVHLVTNMFERRTKDESQED